VAYRDVIDVIADGEAVNASITNRPINQLQENIQFLKTVLDDTAASQAIFDRSATLESTVLVGQPVYYNTSNSRYEQALADGTAKERVVGICYSKTNSTLGDILLAGAVELDISNALGGALVYGPYWLSNADAGEVVDTKPAIAIMVLFAGPSNKIWVCPQTREYRGTALSSGSGTSTDSDVTVFTQSITNGVIGVGTVKNTGGANGLTVREEVTDAFGTSANQENNVAFGASYKLDPSANVDTARPPYVSYVVKVRSQSPGNATTYSAKLSVLPDEG
jgi:hypothetical protein